MSIIGDIFTAVRGGASEVGEAIVSSQDMRILEQEIREADKAIGDAKISLSNLKAREINYAHKIEDCDVDIADYMDNAKEALSKDNRELAIEIANKIATLRDERTSLETQRNELKQQVEKIYKIIKNREQEIEKKKNEIEKIKTYEELQRTQSVMASSLPTNDSSDKRVKRAMERVQKRQAATENRMEADQWLADMESGDDLDSKISAAGIGRSGTSADDILAELEKAS